MREPRSPAREPATALARPAQAACSVGSGRQPRASRARRTRSTTRPGRSRTHHDRTRTTASPPGRSSSWRRTSASDVADVAVVPAVDLDRDAVPLPVGVEHVAAVGPSTHDLPVGHGEPGAAHAARRSAARACECDPPARPAGVIASSTDCRTGASRTRTAVHLGDRGAALLHGHRHQRARPVAAGAGSPRRPAHARPSCRGRTTSRRPGRTASSATAAPSRTPGKRGAACGPKRDARPRPARGSTTLELGREPATSGGAAGQRRPARPAEQHGRPAAAATGVTRPVVLHRPSAPSRCQPAAADAGAATSGRRLAHRGAGASTPSSSATSSRRSCCQCCRSWSTAAGCVDGGARRAPPARRPVQESRGPVDAELAATRSCVPRPPAGGRAHHDVVARAAHARLAARPGRGAAPAGRAAAGTTT